MRKLANRVSPVMLALTNRNTDVHISTAFCVYASKSSCQDGVVGIVTRLGARRSGFEFPTVSSIFFYTVSGKHLPSFSVGKRVLARVHRPGHQVHHSHIYIVMRSRIIGALPLVILYALWHGQRRLYPKCLNLVTFYPYR